MTGLASFGRWVPALRAAMSLGLWLHLVVGPSLAQGKSSGVEEWKQWLDKEQNALEIEKDVFNTECGIVSSHDHAKLQQCTQRRQKLLTRIAKYKHDLAAFEARKGELEWIAAKLEKLDKRIEATKKRIAMHGGQLEDYGAALEEWAQLAVEARTKARHAAAEALAAVLLDGLAHRTDRKIEITEDALAGLKKWRPENVQIAELHRNLVKKLQSATDVSALLAALSTMKDSFLAVTELKTREEALNLVLRLISVVNSAVVVNPGISLLAADGELAVATIYGWKAGSIARERIEQLVAISEQELLALQRLTSLYKADVDERNRLLKERSRLLPSYVK